MTRQHVREARQNLQYGTRHPWEITLLLAPYRGNIRFTINPPTRRSGGRKWDAGPISDWCQCKEADELIVVAAMVESQLDLLKEYGRLDRQRLVHRVAAQFEVCTRAGVGKRHWPKSHPDLSLKRSLTAPLVGGHPTRAHRTPPIPRPGVPQIVTVPWDVPDLWSNPSGSGPDAAGPPRVERLFEGA